MHPISMSYLTAPMADPFESLTIAAQAGYDGLGLRLLDPADGTLSPLVTDRALRTAFVERLADSGLTVTEIEAWVLRDGPQPPTPPEVFEAAAALGQPGLIAVADRVGTVDVPRVAANFAALCRLAADFRLKVGFEPIAHRAGGTLNDALAIAAAGAEWQAGLVFDALHVHRMGMTPADLGRVDPRLVGVFHLCDAPLRAETLAEAIDHSGFNRWLPGEGALPLEAYLDGLAADLPLSLEIPMTRLGPRHPAAQRADMAIVATRALLARRGKGRPC